MVELLAAMVAAALCAMFALLVPMVPGGLVDTRDFSEMPRWQFRLFNVFLVSLGVATLATAWLVIGGTSAAFLASIVVAGLYCLVFAADLGKVFPVVKDSLPVQLIVLEALSLAIAASVICLATVALLQ